MDFHFERRTALDDEMWRSISEQLNDIHEKNKSVNKGWKVDAWADTTPFRFDFASYDYSDYASTWSLNIDLHDAMNEYWEKVAGDIFQLNKFAVWIVEEWGQIRGNNPNTILEYCKKSAKPWTLDGADGVSSYSKILSAKDRHKFFILDTRVAAALNALQFRHFDRSRVYFGITGGRNVAISKFNQVYTKKIFSDIEYKLVQSKIYSTYNSVVSVMARHIGVSGIELEMMLFDNAVSIVSNEDDLQAAYEENIDFKKKQRDEFIRETEARLKAKGWI